uniref:DNA ligase (ATP) n=1 Tax=Panagrolaimus sp. PS1159 TaxID=55785 RepID=A0AC35GDT8_9BILA
MDSKHKWTFNDFVTRVEEFSNAPKRFCAIVFKTLLKEFEFFTNDSEEYGLEVFRDIFFPENTVFMNEFPNGLIRSLLPNNEESVADNDKTKIRDDQIQQIIVKMQSQPKNELSHPPLFEEVFKKLQAFCRDDLKLDEALARLEFVRDFDCLEIEWIFRILTCTVKSKFKCSKAEMLHWFSEAEAQPLNRISSIIGQPQSPMLLVKTSSGPTDYQKILKFCGDSFYVETKYDGERFHVHKMRNNYKFYSRKGADYTEKLGKNSTKEFAAKLHPIFKEDITHCILDCEILVWDRVQKRLVGKNEKASDGVIYDVKNLLESKDEENKAVTRVLCVFDILHLNGVDLIDWTLSARLKILFDDIFNLDMLSEDLLFLSKYTLTTKRKDFLEYYNQAMTQKLEGIVIKSLYSTYLFGSRAQGNGWFKIKPDYGSAHTLDLAIVAIRMDKHDRVQAFELAALASKDPLQFKFVGTVSAHLKRLDRDRLVALLKGDNGLLTNATPPWMKQVFFKDKNIKYVDIKNLVVVEIRASGVMRGALRFPTVVCIRGDKDPIDCDTWKAVEEYEATLRNAIDADNESGFRKRKHQIKTAVPIEYKKFHSSSIDPEARNICCYNIKDSVTPPDLDDLTRLGFNFITNQSKDTVCVVTDEPNSFKIKGVKKKNNVHIVKGDWLKRCHENGALVAWKPEDIIYNCPNATFALFEDSPDVEVLADHDDDNIEEEEMPVEEEVDDVIANDSDPEILMDGLNMDDTDEEM